MKLPFIPKTSLRRIVWILGEHAFFFTLALLGVGVLILALLFRLYVMPIETQSPEVLNVPLQFQKNVFEGVVADWKAQGQKFLETTVAPSDIFLYNPKASDSTSP